MTDPLTPTQLAELRAMPAKRWWATEWPAGLRVFAELGLVGRHPSDPVGAWSTCRRTPAGDALLATVDAEVERAVADGTALIRHLRDDLDDAIADRDPFPASLILADQYLAVAEAAASNEAEKSEVPS